MSVISLSSEDEDDCIFMGNDSEELVIGTSPIVNNKEPDRVLQQTHQVYVEECLPGLTESESGTILPDLSESPVPNSPFKNCSEYRVQENLDPLITESPISCNDEDFLFNCPEWDRVGVVDNLCYESLPKSIPPQVGNSDQYEITSTPDNASIKDLGDCVDSFETMSPQVNKQVDSNALPDSQSQSESLNPQQKNGNSKMQLIAARLLKLLNQNETKNNASISCTTSGFENQNKSFSIANGVKHKDILLEQKPKPNITSTVESHHQSTKPPLCGNETQDISYSTHTFGKKIGNKNNGKTRLNFKKTKRGRKKGWNKSLQELNSNLESHLPMPESKTLELSNGKDIENEKTEAIHINVTDRKKGRIKGSFKMNLDSNNSKLESKTPDISNTEQVFGKHIEGERNEQTHLNLPKKKRGRKKGWTKSSQELTSNFGSHTLTPESETLDLPSPKPFSIKEIDSKKNEPTPKSKRGKVKGLNESHKELLSSLEAHAIPVDKDVLNVVGTNLKKAKKSLVDEVVYEIHQQFIQNKLKINSTAKHVGGSNENENDVIHNRSEKLNAKKRGRKPGPRKSSVKKVEENENPIAARNILSVRVKRSPRRKKETDVTPEQSVQNLEVNQSTDTTHAMNNEKLHFLDKEKTDSIKINSSQLVSFKHGNNSNTSSPSPPIDDMRTNKLKFVLNKDTGKVESVCIVAPKQQFDYEMSNVNISSGKKEENLNSIPNSLKCKGLASYNSDEILRLKAGFIDCYATVFDDTAESLCNKMGDLLYLAVNSSRNYKLRLKTAERITDDSLRAVETATATNSFQSTLLEYRVSFSEMFSKVLTKLYNEKVTNEQYNALMIAWFLKLYLRLTQISLEFSDHLYKVKAIVVFLLNDKLVRLPIVRDFILCHEIYFDQSCWIVLDFMQNCIGTNSEETFQTNVSYTNVVSPPTNVYEGIVHKLSALVNTNNVKVSVTVDSTNGEMNSMEETNSDIVEKYNNEHNISNTYSPTYTTKPEQPNTFQNSASVGLQSVETHTVQYTRPNPPLNTTISTQYSTKCQPQLNDIHISQRNKVLKHNPDNVQETYFTSSRDPQSTRPEATYRTQFTTSLNTDPHTFQRSEFTTSLGPQPDMTQRTQYTSGVEPPSDLSRKTQFTLSIGSRKESTQSPKYTPSVERQSEITQTTQYHSKHGPSQDRTHRARFDTGYQQQSPATNRLQFNTSYQQQSQATDRAQFNTSYQHQSASTHSTQHSSVVGPHTEIQPISHPNYHQSEDSMTGDQQKKVCIEKSEFRLPSVASIKFNKMGASGQTSHFNPSTNTSFPLRNCSLNQTFIENSNYQTNPLNLKSEETFNKSNQEILKTLLSTSNTQQKFDSNALKHASSLTTQQDVVSDFQKFQGQSHTVHHYPHQNNFAKSVPFNTQQATQSQFHNQYAYSNKDYGLMNSPQWYQPPHKYSRMYLPPTSNKLLSQEMYSSFQGSSNVASVAADNLISHSYPNTYADYQNALTGDSVASKSAQNVANICQKTPEVTINNYNVTAYVPPNFNCQLGNTNFEFRSSNC